MFVFILLPCQTNLQIANYLSWQICFYRNLLVPNLLVKQASMWIWLICKKLLDRSSGSSLQEFVV